MAQREVKFIKKLYLIIYLVIYTSCQAGANPQLKLSNGKTIKVQVAISPSAQAKGLSGVKPHQWPNGQGMLFVYPTMSPKMFWMPNTFMNLDIFFLDKNLKVLEVVRDIPHHPGHDESVLPIARTPTYYAQHVFELKSKDPISQQIKKGDTLKWIYEKPLMEIKSDIHPLK